jgi:ankyrin repeat protein
MIIEIEVTFLDDNKYSEQEELLIKKGCYPETDERGKRSFIEAVETGDLEVIKAYISIGMPVNLQFDSSTPLMRAIEKGNLEVVKYLVFQGADIELMDEYGDTPLHTAINWDEAEIVRFLVSCRADMKVLSGEGYTCLSSVIKYKELEKNNHRQEILDFLIESGAEIDQKNVYGTTALWEAAVNASKIMYGRSECEENTLFMRKLIKAGADLNTISDTGTPLLVFLSAEDYNYIDQIKILILAGADVNIKNSYGWTPYMTAMWFKKEERAVFLKEQGALTEGIEIVDLFNSIVEVDLSKVKEYLNEGIDINVSTVFGNTPLMLACEHEQLELVKFLIERGAELNKENSSGENAVYISATGRCDILELLLKNGAAINCKKPVLVKAVTKEGLGNIKLLLKAGVNLNEVNYEGYSALMKAINNDNNEVAEFLINQGINVNLQTKDTSRYNALYLAVNRKNKKVVSLLIKAGGDVNLSCYWGNPTIKAVEEGDIDILIELLEAGADPMAADKYGNTALSISKSEYRGANKKCERIILYHLFYKNYWAAIRSMAKDMSEEGLIEWIKEGREDIVEILLEEGINPNARVKETGETALEAAIEMNNFKLVVTLLKRGAAVNTLGKEEESPLMKACIMGNEAIVRLLIEHGAEINFKNKFNITSMHKVAAEGNYSIIKLLLESGAEIDAVSIEGFTPIMEAARKDQVEILRFLIKKGADINILNKKKENSLIIALKNCSYECINPLIETGIALKEEDNEGNTAVSLSEDKGLQDIKEVLLGIINGGEYRAEKTMWKLRCENLRNNSLEASKQLNNLLKEGITQENPDLIRRTLIEGAKVLDISKKEFSPLLEAAKQKQAGILKLLLEGALIEALMQSGLSVKYSSEKLNRANNLVNKYFIKEKGKQRWVFEVKISVYLNLSSKASVEDEIIKLREILKPLGFLVFISNKRKEDLTEITFIKADKPYDALSYYHTSSLYYSLSTKDIIEKIEEWDKIYGIELIAAGKDWLQLYFKNIPAYLNTFQWEVYNFCPEYAAGKDREDLMSNLESDSILNLSWFN